VATWRSLGDVPADVGPSVVTVGNFDGVHRGHRRVIDCARQTADELGIDRVVAVTFDPHPLAVLRPDHAPQALTDLPEKARLLDQAGVRDVLVVPFSRDVAGWPPERFVLDILVRGLQARAVVVGENFRFGNQAAGDVATLEQLGAEHDFVTVAVPLAGGRRVWSSTYIRECLAAGDVAAAAEALGRPYSVRGVVVEGEHRGRQLGFPTANVPAAGDHAVPADGVYAGWLRVSGGPPEPAAISVGTNPTFAGDRARAVESYVLDRDDLELYGVEVEVAFVARIRGMARFDSVEELVATMKDDVATTRGLLHV
jgi:riboflavin kinase/FMN adenylyltransferase